jgi:hypothetical protein
MSLFRYLADTLGGLWRGPASGRDFRKEGGLLAFRLLQDDGVRKELGLSVEQLGMISKFTREARQRHRKDFGRLRRLEPQQRREEGQRLLMAVAEAALKGIHEARILNDSQKRRLQQISWQNRGLRAFADPALADALGLSEGQREMVLTLLSEAGKRLREVLQPGEDGMSEEGAGEGAKEKVAAVRREMMEKMLSTLSDEQRRRWDEVKGAPFEINPQDLGPQRPRAGGRPLTLPSPPQGERVG